MQDLLVVVYFQCVVITFMEVKDLNTSTMFTHTVVQIGWQ